MTLKHVLQATAAAAAIAASTAASPMAQASPTAARVTIENYAYHPATVTIPAGGTVVWTQKDDDPHTVTALDGSFDSKGLGQGDTFTHRFTKPGRYAYHCTAHPFMKGTVVVVAEGAR